MKKERIIFPDKIIWSEFQTIKAEDINRAGHMGNERILVWADEIRRRALKNIGWSEDEVSSHGIIVANHTIVYQSEGFLGDEIGIDVGVDFITEFSFDMVLRLKKIGATRNLIMMRTGVVCFDYEKREVAKIPLQIFSQLQ